ncbi:ABC transporter ATP-binding protein [Aeromicrobium massiliense]|uniref:ABC transporter ATP-binding protein n=1 Tax=Aeromicrobium massiliense TaxID=1464554 RepID=UPI00030CA524|nr:ABC transporter ATP-binding protein [Aeromicrobium massiliense]
MTPPAPAGPRWRLLAGYVRPHRATLIVSILLGFAATAAELVGPLVTRSVLEGLESGASLAGPVLLLVVVLVVGNAIGYVQTVMLGTMAEQVIRGARRTMLGRLLGARPDVLIGRTGGEMVSRVTSDTTLIREATTSSLVYLVNGAVSLVGSLVLMAYLDLPLLVATVLVVVTGMVLAGSLMPLMARLQQESQAELGHLGARLDGVGRALRTVKASRAEQRELERLGRHVDEAAALGVRVVRLEAVAWTLTGIAVNLVVLVVLGFGAYRVSAGALDVPTLVAFLLYVFGLMWPVMMVTMGLTSLQSGLAAAARIDEVVSLPQEVDPPTASAEPAGTDPDGPVLALEDVTVRYRPDGPFALDGVSLTIPRRGHTALVGPSGAGKTTVLSLLLKLLHPVRGRVLLDGVPYDGWTAHAVRGRLGYVEQDTPLVPGSVRDNVVHAAPEADDAAVWAALEAVHLADTVRALPSGIDTEVDATRLSGGERQRLAVARALVWRPEVVLLDEATAQLDALTESAVAEGVRRLARDGAVVSVAHRLSTVMDADRIVLLEAGRVRAVGRHEDLLSDELYAGLVAALRIGPVVTAPE